MDIQNLVKYKLSISVYNMGSKYYENYFVFDEFPTEQEIQETKDYVRERCLFGSMECEITKFWKV